MGLQVIPSHIFSFSCRQTWAPEFGESRGQSAYAPSCQPAQPKGRKQRQRPQRQHRPKGRQWLGFQTGPARGRTVQHTRQTVKSCGCTVVTDKSHALPQVC